MHALALDTSSWKISRAFAAFQLLELRGNKISFHGSGIIFGPTGPDIYIREGPVRSIRKLLVTLSPFVSICLHYWSGPVGPFWSENYTRLFSRSYPILPYYKLAECPPSASYGADASPPMPSATVGYNFRTKTDRSDRTNTLDRSLCGRSESCYTSFRPLYRLVCSRLAFSVLGTTLQTGPVR